MVDGLSRTVCRHRVGVAWTPLVEARPSLIRRGWPSSRIGDAWVSLQWLPNKCPKSWASQPVGNPVVEVVFYGGRCVKYPSKHRLCRMGPGGELTGREGVRGSRLWPIGPPTSSGAVDHLVPLIFRVPGRSWRVFLGLAPSRWQYWILRLVVWPSWWKGRRSF